MGVIVTFYKVEIDKTDGGVWVETKNPAVSCWGTGTRLILRQGRGVQGKKQHDYRQYFLHLGKCITINLFCKFLSTKIMSTPAAEAAGVEQGVYN